MKYKNWDNFKVHVSGISQIMTRPRGFNDLTQRDRKELDRLSAKEEKTDGDVGQIAFFNQKRENFKNPPLSATAKSYLVERYSSEKYNIRRAASGMPQNGKLTKGFFLENEGIELISYIDKIKYEQPECAISNDYLLGLCDILCYQNQKIVEVKTSWNAASFMSNRKENKLPFSNWCQIQGYLELYNIDFGQVCHVLVNTPPHLVDQERTNLFRRYTFGDISRDKYEEELSKFDSLYDYSKIPITKRVIRFDVPRYKDFMPLVYSKVGKCREFLNEFERRFLLNKNVVALPEQYINAGPDIEENSSEHNPTESHSGNEG